MGRESQLTSAACAAISSSSTNAIRLTGMKPPYTFYLIPFMVLLTGCAATSARNRTAASVPSGPTTTATTSSTLIPAGTTLVVRANETIAAERAEPGRHYDAEIAQDVVNARGQVLLPRGAPAKLTVLEASTGGTVGTSNLVLALASVSTDGRTYTVETNVAERQGTQGLGANERTARNVGGGAALGGLIGAVAGGGSGAAAGAAIGAAAGGAAQVLTRGEAVRVPAESVLTFRLEEPISLR
jgi:hypothetical protein